jgi:uncharacterized membrane protein YpjA
MLGEFSEKVFSNRKLLLLLVIFNALGFFAGMYSYYPQLSETPSYLWLVVLDCPIAVLLFAFVCALLCLRTEVPNAFKFFTSAYVIKYGIWTVITLILYWNYYVANETLGILTLVLHVGMVAEGIILIPRIRPDKYNGAIILALLLLNDFFDYFLGTHPVIPPEHVAFLMYESFVSSILITLSTVLLAKRQ